jgi:hypothetical protein
MMEVEAHITDVRQSAGETAILFDASLWVDGLRIYEIKNAAVGILEG